MPDLEPGSSCPLCRAALTAVPDGAPWCPDCEWNLLAAPPALRRRQRRAAVRSRAADARLAAQVTGRPPRRDRPSARTAVLLAVSAVLALGTLALFVTGVAMVVAGSIVWKLLGVIVAMVAVELRPRLSRLTVELGVVRRGEQPALFDVLDAVSRELGAPLVDTVVLDEGFDASCTRVGVRRRPVLRLGLPLWAALGPAARLALLGHVIGHLVCGDPRQRLVCQPALTTFAHLSRLFDPRGVVRRHQVEARDGYDGALTTHVAQGYLLWEGLANLLSAVVFAPLRWGCDAIQAGLEAVAAQDGRRAEYVADALAADLAGTAATGEYLETLLLAEPVSTAVHRWLRVGASVDTVRWEAAEARERNAADLRRAEQRSIRLESSPTAAHPPTGLRLRALRSWPSGSGRLDPQRVPVEAADAQLAPAYRRVERALAHVL